MRADYWRNFQAQWNHNRRVIVRAAAGGQASLPPPPLAEADRYHAPPLPLEPIFRCDSDDLALNVAIHERRGDITSSWVGGDNERLENVTRVCARDARCSLPLSVGR